MYSWFWTNIVSCDIRNYSLNLCFLSIRTRFEQYLYGMDANDVHYESLPRLRLVLGVRNTISLPKWTSFCIVWSPSSLPTSMNSHFSPLRLIICCFLNQGTITCCSQAHVFQHWYFCWCCFLNNFPCLLFLPPISVWKNRGRDQGETNEMSFVVGSS